MNVWLELAFYDYRWCFTHHVFFDACKVSLKSCQFPKVSPVFRIFSWTSDNQMVNKCLLDLTADKDGMSSFNL